MKPLTEMQRWNAVALGSGLACVDLAAYVNQTLAVDTIAHSWAIAHNSPLLVNIWEMLSLLGSVPVLTAIVIFTLVGLEILHRRPEAKWLLMVMLGSVAIEQVSKWIFQRPRPTEVYPGTMPASFSFPSGHAFYNLVFYFSIAFLIARRPLTPLAWSMWGAAAAVSLAIGASRIFLCVHYLSDVIGGFLAATMWFACAAATLSDNTTRTDQTRPAPPPT